MNNKGISDSIFDRLVFDNEFSSSLPSDRMEVNRPRQVAGACYSRVLPQQVTSPILISHSPEVAREIGLLKEQETVSTRDQAQFAQVFSGNELLEGMDPFAMCYGGHQFGHWAGQLGDGRAINLGEVISPHQQRLMLQLKGAGPTPYSRSADGFAVLRSSVREYLCSEAMFHLGVPTTRALSLVLTGEEVVRDMFYDGNPQAEPGAVVCRVAPSFIRFGNFELPASRGEIDLLRTLLDFTIKVHFPHLGEPGKETYLQWYREVCELTADMVVHWMRVGFVHGVMNTDNMSVLGLTIDYGPYGWLEDYDLEWTPNTTDAGGRRYAFGQQPRIAQWNLAQLGNALYPLIEDIDSLQEVFGSFKRRYSLQWRRMMLDKLGLAEYQGESDDQRFAELEKLLQVVETDMTIFFRRLANFDVEAEPGAEDPKVLLAPLMDAFYQPDALPAEHVADVTAWLRRYAGRVRSENRSAAERQAQMNRTNPKFVLRNYLAQQAIDKAETGVYSLIEALLEVLRQPYDEQPGREAFAAKRPDWARERAGCSMLSCSS
ncbi:MAG: protein adenylyltransferase SelO [Thiotrichales bacterium]